MRRIGMTLCALAIGAPCAPAFATTFTVTNTLDTGAGSLRQAIDSANTTAGADEIHFAIPGDGPHTIALVSQLSAITQTVLIDGYTQPGAIKNSNTPDQGGLNGTLKIEVAGPGSSFYGFYTDTANGVTITVQGLAMHGFIAPLFGAPIGGTSQVRSFGNYLCSNIAGTASTQDTTYGLNLNASKATIGGELPEQRNLISGCKNSAIVVSADADIRGNLIGTDASGTVAVRNGGFDNAPGINISNVAATVQIGGGNANARNVISGNQTFGIFAFNTIAAPHFTGIAIKGNYIGTDVTGTQPLPNGFGVAQFAAFGGGIRVGANTGDDTPLVIGGFGVGEANLIAFNNGSGISVSFNDATNAFDSRANEVHGNTFGGATDIDISDFGPTPNDPGDPDVGSNNQQNAPVILLAGEIGDLTQGSIKYVVDTLQGNAVYPLRIDFYVGLPDGGSGAFFTQDTYVEAVAGQQRTHTFALGPGQKAFPVTATATDATGHTSELSAVYDTLFKDGYE